MDNRIGYTAENFKSAVDKFYQMPRFLDAPEFYELSIHAKILYVYLLDRLKLSLSSNWFDEENGQVFMYFKREEMQKALKLTAKTVKKVVDELKTHNLMSEKTQGINLPNKIFLFAPKEEICSEKNFANEQEKILSRAGNNSTSEHGNFPTTEGEIFPPIKNENIKNKHNENERNKTATAPEEAAATPPEVENFAPLDEIMRLYNEFCDKLRPIVSINGERRKKISARFNEYGIDGIKTIFVQAAQSDFLCGGGERGWKADFDWLIDANNFQKVLEGKYDNDYRVSEKNPLRETRFYTENLPTNARPIPLSDTGQGFLFVPAQNGVIEMPFSSHEKMTEPRAAPYQRYRNKNGFNTMAVLQEMLDAEEFHGEEVAV